MSLQDTSGLIFRQASDEQLDLVWTLNAEAWAAPISTEAHIIRERFLSQQPLTGANWRTFVLFREKDEIIASCEAFEKQILISDRNGFRKELGYGIASVYTNPRYRRQKMAAFLLMKLAEWMDGEGNGTLSVLYSDIGKVCYPQASLSSGHIMTCIFLIASNLIRRLTTRSWAGHRIHPGSLF